MKSLKELSAGNIISLGIDLEPEDADVILAVLNSVKSDTSKYEVVNDNLRHWRKETDGLVTKEYINGTLFKEVALHLNGNQAYEIYFNKEGDKHREQVGKDAGPAQTNWYPNGNKQMEIWYIDGKLSRDFEPAVQEWYEDGSVEYKAWYKDNYFYREGVGTMSIEPSEIRWHENGNKQYETWRTEVQWMELGGTEGYYFQVFYRENGPAEISYYDDESKRYEIWYNKEGNLHRENGTAVMNWYDNGNKFYEKWYRNGELYRGNKLPYFTEWRIDGTIELQLVM